MTNKAGGSKACNRCKTRKIGCSGDRSGCLQCAKVKQACPGYDEADDRRFRPFQSGKVSSQKRTKKPVANDSNRNHFMGAGLQNLTEKVQAQGELSVACLARPGSAKSTLQIPLTVNSNSVWQPQLVNSFLSHYVNLPDPNDEFSRGWFDFIPTLLGGSDENSCLRATVEAASWANFANQRPTSSLKRGVHRFCGIALFRMQKALNEPQVAQSDDTLAAAILLGLLENLMGQGGRSNLLGSHTDGILTLIKIRGLQQFQQEIGRSLYRHVRSCMRTDQFDHGEIHVPYYQEWREHSQGTSWESSEIGCVFTRCSRLAKTVNKSLKGLSGELISVGLLEGLHSEGKSLQKEMQDWAQSNPSEVGHSVSLPSELRQDLQPKFLVLYMSFRHCIRSTLYRIGGISLHTALHQLASFISKALPTGCEASKANHFRIETEKSEQTLHQLMDELCASVPYAFGDVDESGKITQGSARTSIKAGIFAWSLRVCKASVFSSLEQRVYVAKTLNRLAPPYGPRITFEKLE